MKFFQIFFIVYLLAAFYSFKGSDRLKAAWKAAAIVIKTISVTHFQIIIKFQKAAYKLEIVFPPKFRRDDKDV